MSEDEEEKKAYKNKVTIYLLKKDADFNSALKEEKNSEVLYHYSDECILYFTRSTPGPPLWLKKFFKIDSKTQSKNNDSYHVKEDVIRGLVSSSSSAILLFRREYKSENRIFALTFGQGRHVLADDVIEDRFGLKIALNSIGGGDIRGLKKTEIGSTMKSSVEQMPRVSDFSVFGINEETDLIKQITAKPDGEFLKGCTINGSDSLTASVSVDIGNLPELLDKSYEKYNETGYKERFEWIDNIQNVKSKAMIERLDAKLVNAYSECGKEVWMAVPDIIDWENIGHFKYGGCTGEFDDIEIGAFRKCHNEIDDVQNLKDIKIYEMLENGRTGKSWSAYKCMIAEIEMDGSYCLEGGNWYKIEPDFLKRINGTYYGIPRSGIKLPDCGRKEEEEAYNKRVAKICGASLADRRMIHFGGNRSSIEICDFIFDRRNLVHVKKYTGSRDMSHLFSQGLVSAESLAIDDFRKEVRKEFDEKELDIFGEFNPKNYTVTYAIISDKTEEPPKLPFFSRVNAKTVYSVLRGRGYKVEIKTVNYGNRV